MGQVEDVVAAGTRFVSDSRVLGRSLVIGPKVHVRQKDDGEWDLVTPASPGSIETAIFEPYADDWEDVDAWDRNMVKILNLVQAGRGWAGWAQDIVKAVFYGFRLAVGERDRHRLAIGFSCVRKNAGTGGTSGYRR